MIGYRDPDNLQLIYSLVIKDYWNEPPGDEHDLCRILCELKETLKTEGIRCIAMPKLGCGDDQYRWQQMSYAIEKYFRHEGITIYVYVSGAELEAIKNMENFNFSDENISEIMETIADETVKSVKLKTKLQQISQMMQKIFANLNVLNNSQHTAPKRKSISFLMIMSSGGLVIPCLGRK